MSFIKTVENFTCEHCGHENIGTGFTNHCQKCLWSKHVDVDPGDRASSCGGMMEPVDVEVKNGVYRIHLKCQKCAFMRWAPVLPEDNFDVVLSISKKKENLLR